MKVDPSEATTLYRCMKCSFVTRDKLEMHRHVIEQEHRGFSGEYVDPSEATSRARALPEKWRAEAAKWDHGIGENQNTRLLNECADELEPVLSALLASVEILETALRTYGRHHASCAVFVMTWEGRRPSGKPCDCGLVAGLAAEEVKRAG